MDMPTADTLYRKYLAKIAPDLRGRVLSKEWKLDGDDMPVRAVRTFTDVAKAVSLLLEERADIRATGYDQYDSFMSIDGGTGGKGDPSTRGNSVTCSYCQMANNHHSTVCPQRAADTRNESKACFARSQSGGRVCSICGGPGHEQRHHQMAVTDYATKLSSGKSTKGGKGESKGGKGAGSDVKCFTCGGNHFAKDCPGKSGGSGGVQKAMCSYGPKCKAMLKDGKCENRHPPPEYKELLQKFKANKAGLKGWEAGQAHKKGKGKDGKARVRPGKARVKTARAARMVLPTAVSYARTRITKPTVLRSRQEANRQKLRLKCHRRRPRGSLIGS